MELEELCCCRTVTQAKVEVDSKLGGCSAFFCLSNEKKIDFGGRFGERAGGGELSTPYERAGRQVSYFFLLFGVCPTFSYF